MLLSFVAAALLVSVQLQAKSPGNIALEDQRAATSSKPRPTRYLRSDTDSDSSPQVQADLSDSTVVDSSLERDSMLLASSVSRQQATSVTSSKPTSVPFVFTSAQPDITTTAAIERLIATPVHQTWATINPLFESVSASIPDSTQKTDDIRVVIDLSDRLVHTYDDADQLRHSFPIAVGKAGWETPVGEFSILEKRINPSWQHPITHEIVPPGPNNPLGSHWIAFWTNGRNKIGFHGTNDAGLIGQAVSHGCVRMRNDEIQILYELVNIGTTVIVQP
jgi:lipoprotein-anchoring transpeptidase ErfK/SrfK